MLRILIADPDPGTALAVEQLFGERHATRLEVQACASLEEACSQAAQRRPTAVLAGSSLLPLEQEDQLRELVGRFAPAPLVVLAEPEHARRCGRVVVAGAYDWIPKDSPLFLALPRIIVHAVERAQAERAMAQFEQAARSAETLLADILESAPWAALLLDAAGRIQQCNSAAERLLYRNRRRIEGREFADFLVKSSLPSFREAFRRATTRVGQQQTAHVWLATADESEVVQLEMRGSAGDGEGPMVVLWLHPVDKDITWVEAHPDSDLRRILEKVTASGRSQVPIVQVHLLGLGEVREALGQRWPEMEWRVHRIVQRVLANLLQPHERWCRNGEDGYILVFTRATAEEAAKRAETIAEAIRAAVLGADDLTARARSLVPPVPEAQRHALAQIVTALGEADGSGLTLARPAVVAPPENDRVADLGRRLREVLEVDFEPV